MKGMKRLKDIESNAETDSINMERYVEELSKVGWDMFRATGAIFEQEPLMFISMFAATGSGGNGGRHMFNKGIIEHKVINNLRCVRGDKSLSRQWHQRFVTALGSYDQAHEGIIKDLVAKTDLGKDLDKVAESCTVETLHVSREMCGASSWTRRRTRRTTRSQVFNKETESLHTEFDIAVSLK